MQGKTSQGIKKNGVINMKKCSDYKLLISRYIDSDVNDDENKKIRLHLDDCENCRKLYNDYISMGKILSFAFSQNQYQPASIQANIDNHLSPLNKFIMNMAAVLLLSVMMISAIFVFRQNRICRQECVLLEQDCLPLMNFPLGAFVYYENAENKTVQDQFGIIRLDGLFYGYQLESIYDNMQQ